jgi:hypothetical protein
MNIEQGISNRERWISKRDGDLVFVENDKEESGTSFDIPCLNCVHARRTL